MWLDCKIQLNHRAVTRVVSEKILVKSGKEFMFGYKGQLYLIKKSFHPIKVLVVEDGHPTLHLYMYIKLKLFSILWRKYFFPQTAPGECKPGALYLVCSVWLLHHAYF